MRIGLDAGLSDAQAPGSSDSALPFCPSRFGAHSLPANAALKSRAGTRGFAAHNTERLTSIVGQPPPPRQSPGGASIVQRLNDGAPTAPRKLEAEAGLADDDDGAAARRRVAAPSSPGRPRGARRGLAGIHK